MRSIVRAGVDRAFDSSSVHGGKIVCAEERQSEGIGDNEQRVRRQGAPRYRNQIERSTVPVYIKADGIRDSVHRTHRNIRKENAPPGQSRREIRAQESSSALRRNFWRPSEDEDEFMTLITDSCNLTDSLQTPVI